MRPSGTAQELAQRRQRAAALFAEDWTNAQIAARLGTTPQSVGRWRRQWEAGGDEALAPKPTPGRPSRLSARQKRGLRQRLLSGARRQGFATDLWTGRRARELIRRCYGVEYHIGYVDRLLTQLGFSPSETRASRRRAR